MNMKRVLLLGENFLKSVKPRRFFAVAVIVVGSFIILAVYSSQLITSSHHFDGYFSESGQAHVSDSEAEKALQNMAAIIHHPLKPSCEVIPFGMDGGDNYGRHDICKREYSAPCIVLTYGVQQEYSFELGVRKKFGCVVFALDPTVNYQAQLDEGVYFLKWGAPSQATAEWLGPQDNWVNVAPVTLASLVAPNQHIPILKMDCEGCEYKLYEPIMKHDPKFFERVDQLAIEVHLSKALGMASRQDALEWGRTLVLLERAGHQLQDVSIGSCAAVDEKTGTADLMAEVGYANKENLDPGNRGHCHNYLFARA
mmetsp:Transcript_13577/g.59276  ORF Transcript_13577/g.59276 Transcript_13577/m.59276 type:complete len:311 (-) Transcript_13577:399-1331(-)